jgi:hypothetical protein
MRNFLLITLVAALAAAVPAFEAPALAQQSGTKQQQVKLQKGTWWGSVGDRVEVVVKEQLSTRTLTATVTKIDADKGIVTVDAEVDGKKVTRPLFASNIVSMKTVGSARSAPPRPGASERPAALPAGRPRDRREAPAARRCFGAGGASPKCRGQRNRDH